jgi:hypothetical protein
MRVLKLDVAGLEALHQGDHIAVESSAPQHGGAGAERGRAQAQQPSGYSAVHALERAGRCHAQLIGLGALAGMNLIAFAQACIGSNESVVLPGNPKHRPARKGPR